MKKCLLLCHPTPYCERHNLYLIDVLRILPSKQLVLVVVSKTPDYRTARRKGTTKNSNNETLHLLKNKKTIEVFY